MAIVNPTPVNANSVHVDAPLSDFATAYKNSGFLADKLAPIIKVDKRSDKFFTRTRRDVSHIPSDLMGPRSEAQETTYELATDNYSVQDRALKDLVPYAVEQNADAPLKPEELATQNIMQRLMLARESRVATLLCTAGSYSATTAVSAVWTNETTSTPVSDINTAIAAIPFSGEDANLVAWMARPVWNALRKHPALLAMKGLDKGQVSRADFASFFELDDVFVSDLWYDTTNIGQTASYSRVYTATVFGVLRVPKMISGPDVSMFLGTFRVNPGIEVRTWESPEKGVKGSKTVQVGFSDDEKIIQNDMGYLLTSVA